MAHTKLYQLVLAIVFFSSLLSVKPLSEVDALLKFKSSLTNTKALSNWNNSTSPCLWTGLHCASHGELFGMYLQDMELGGLIDTEALSAFPSLRSLGLMSNGFEGPLPTLNNLGAIRGLYFSGNKFSGEIWEDAFDGMIELKSVYLNGNRFSGNIPSSLAAVPRLVELDLQGNKFTGRIPDFKHQEWRVMNLSHNQLEGPIPVSLSNLDASSFLGNKGLCGKPLAPCKSSRKWINLF